MRRFALLAVIVALACAQAVSAQEGREKKARQRGNPLAKLDTDGDGKLSKDEYRGPDEAFVRLDADGDGFVGAEEARQANKVLNDLTWEKVDRQAMFKAIDADGDGVVTQDEFMGASLAEIVGKATQQAKRAMYGKASKAGREKRKKGDFLSRLDKDGDGKLSKDELPEKMQQRFDRLDKDGDGLVTAEEMKAARGARGKKRKKGGEGE